MSAYIKKSELSKKYPNAAPQTLRKNKLKISRENKTIKFGAEINEMTFKKQTKRISKTNNSVYKP
jgi:hypothetical protein